MQQILEGLPTTLTKQFTTLTLLHFNHKNSCLHLSGFELEWYTAFILLQNKSMGAETM